MQTHVAPPGNLAATEAARALRHPVTLPLARQLERTAQDLDDGVDPAIIAGRLRRYAVNTDPAITITIKR